MSNLLFGFYGSLLVLIVALVNQPKTKMASRIRHLIIVVSAIFSVLTIALPRYGGIGSASCSILKDTRSQLVSAAAIYTAQTGKVPNGFVDFVTFEKKIKPPYTITLSHLGPNNRGTCYFAGNTIYCPDISFKGYKDIHYVWENGKISLLPVTPEKNHTPCQ